MKLIKGDPDCVLCEFGLILESKTEDKLSWSSICQCAKVELEDGSVVPATEFITKNHPIIGISMGSSCPTTMERRCIDTNCECGKCRNDYVEYPPLRTEPITTVPKECKNEHDAHVETARKMLERVGEPGIIVKPGKRLETSSRVFEETYSGIKSEEEIVVEDPSGAISELMKDFKKKISGTKLKVVAASPKSYLREEIEEFDDNNIEVADVSLNDLLHLRGVAPDDEGGLRVWNFVNYLRSVWTSRISRIGTLYLHRDSDGILELRVPLRWKANKDEFESLREEMGEDVEE